MKIELICPRKVFVKGNTKSKSQVDTLINLGFEFQERQDGPVTFLNVVGPIFVELNTMEELMELQRQAGDTLVVNEGVIEIGI